MENSVRGSQSEPPSRSPRDQDYGIVVFSHLRWSFVWQRPQQFLSRFADVHRVLFVEEPDFCLGEEDTPSMRLDTPQPNITTVYVQLPTSMRDTPEAAETMRAFTREALAEVNAHGSFDLPLHWYYSPTEAAWSLRHFPARAVVYDCMDELSLFAGAPKELVQNEQALLKAADIVFTGGYELWLSKSQQHDNVHFFGCGVEYDHFARAQDDSSPPPQDVRELPKPVVGWFGVIDERVDYDLLRRVSELRPNWSFVMVGPVVKVNPATLPQAPNLHWLGGRDYKVLPDYCRAFDVCMMAFALNDATRYINPTKALEYFATGRPVVSTPVADVVRQYSGLLEIAKTPEQFVAAVEAAIDDRCSTRVLQAAQKSAACSWDSTVLRMQDLIADAIQRRVSQRRAYVS
jgi:glycosyltransferase involved in cell wall biosynthesis